MVVTWVTMDYTSDSIVEYNKRGGPLDYKAHGTVDLFVDGGSDKRKIYMHRVTLTGLVPRVSYGNVKQELPKMWHINESFFLHILATLISIFMFYTTPQALALNIIVYK